MMPARADTAIDSTRTHLGDLRNGVIAQSRMAGAISKVPAASAGHQVSQVATGSGKPGSLETINPAMAMVERIIVAGAKQMIANFATSEGVANIRSPFDQRPISHVPANAARSAPTPREPDSRIDCSRIDWSAMR